MPCLAELPLSSGETEIPQCFKCHLLSLAHFDQPINLQSFIRYQLWSLFSGISPLSLKSEILSFSCRCLKTASLPSVLPTHLPSNRNLLSIPWQAPDDTFQSRCYTSSLVLAAVFCPHRASLILALLWLSDLPTRQFSGSDTYAPWLPTDALETWSIEKDSTL